MSVAILKKESDFLDTRRADRGQHRSRVLRHDFLDRHDAIVSPLVEVVPTMKLRIFGLIVFFALAACTEQGHPPLINSGSYDWTDGYHGPNGYYLPGWNIGWAK
jgi:hypothetical protein